MSTGERTDAELLDAAGHDPAAFRELYDRHAVAVHAFALRRVGSPEAALEITAETFARAWYSRRKFRDQRDGTVLPWLYGVAANVIRESARRRRMASRAIDRLGVTIGLDRVQTVPDPSWVDGLDADLQAALAALSPDERAAVVGRVMEDISYDQLAVALECSPETARARVSRGLSNLRRVLQEERDEQR